MLSVRPAAATDFAAMHRIFDSVVEAGETYIFEGGMSEEEIRAYWFDEGVTSFVCSDGERVLGMYKLVPNQRGRGAHVANASFMVAAEARGRGIGRRLGESCLEQARRAGFHAMQFNFVVSTNQSAVKLWLDLGFEIVGTLPGAFRHATQGYVDAYIMYRAL